MAAAPRRPHLPLPPRGRPRRRRSRGVTAAWTSVAFAVVLTAAGCAALQGLKDRLGILGVKFDMDRVDVSRLVYRSYTQQMSTWAKT